MICLRGLGLPFPCSLEEFWSVGWRGFHPTPWYLGCFRVLSIPHHGVRDIFLIWIPPKTQDQSSSFTKVQPGLPSGGVGL